MGCLAKMNLVNLHPPIIGGPPFPPFNMGDPPFFKGSRLIGLTNSLLKKGGYVHPEKRVTPKDGHIIKACLNKLN